MVGLPRLAHALGFERPRADGDGDRAGHEPADRSRTDHLATDAGAHARLLRPGTGTGALLIAREFPQARVRGVDLSEEMIRLAQGRIGLDPDGRVAFRVADASSLPWDDDSFDLVAQLNMTPFFAETARVLRPGGYAIAATSWGASTPFYTPPSVLERSFRRRGLEPIRSGEAGRGTYTVVRALAATPP
jgi:SAM-dependent methyltransferase